MTTRAAAPAPAVVDRSRILRAGLITVLGSVAANVLLALILTPLLGLSSTFPPFSLAAIAFFTALYTALAVVLFWLLVRFTKQPIRIFTIIAVVAFVLTAIPNVLAAVNPATAPFPGSSGDYLTLLLFHVPPFVITLWALTTLTRARALGPPLGRYEPQRPQRPRKALLA